MAATSSLRRRLYLWLTTSQRDRVNRKDFVSQQAMARSQRDRVQKVNDLFHHAGQQGKLHTYESVTLQFKGNAWGFLILPAALASALLLFISGYQSNERISRREKEQRHLEERATASRTKAEEAQRLLGETRRGVPALLDELRVSEDEKRLTAQLEENMKFFSEKAALAESSAAPPSGL